MNENQQLICAAVDRHMDRLKALRDYLYHNPEVGGTEAKASAMLCSILREEGFGVQERFQGLDYCFRAVWEGTMPGPSVGLMAEYDALPEIGHGCGHDIIAAISLGAALALKEAVSRCGGRVILYGTPAEENLVSKRSLARAGVFEEIDVAMMAHPGPVNLSSGSSTLALEAWQVDFYGKSAHAGAHPEEGINALDAAVHFYTLIGFQKQYMKDTNIYGVFADGGKKCSVIPDHAAVKYLVRARTAGQVEQVRGLFERCAQAACDAVGTTYKLWNNEPGSLDMRANQVLAQVFDRHYEALGGGEMPPEDITGSTDMGDVSHKVPSIHAWVGLDCPELALHSREFAAQTLTEKGDRAIRLGAQALALTGLDVLTDRELLKRIKEAF